MSKKLLFVIATDKYFLSHRLGWAKSAKDAGFDVALATSFEGKNQEFIEQEGIQTFPLHFLKRGLCSPLHDLFAFIELLIIYNRYQPDLTHHVALKPIIFGSLTAKILNFLQKKTQKVIHSVNTFGGLGFVFTKKTFLRLGVTFLLRQALAKTTVVVQNTADQEILTTYRCLKESVVHCIPGAGIAVDDFTVEPLPAAPPYRFIFVGRLLWTKGLGELAAAARLLKDQQFPFVIEAWGTPDNQNPASIPEDTLQHWEQAGLINFKGYAENVNAIYATGHVAILPSYREGLPKSLLEAAACGRAIITTDAPGCRDVVQVDKTGWIVPVQDPAALAKAMRECVQDIQQCEQYGLQGRQYVQTFFSDTSIHAALLRIYDAIF